ncbi:ROK family transcriptional regulator [Georgenia wangjunii]|uniref:ROK family transcriptional regulator n=1 Tax=Georgenia wangjunii TaxID=3117730 RepID=UPI002F25FC2E
MSGRTDEDQAAPSLGAAYSQGSLRTQNLALVAAHAFRSEQRLSRAGLAEATGLTRSTVSRLVGELVEARILDELSPHEGRQGRPAIPLAPAARSIVGIGLEVSGGYLAGRAVDLRGAVLTESIVHGRFEHSAPGPVLARLGDLLRGMSTGGALDGARIAGVNLALPGLVDPAAGRLLRAPNLGWDELHPEEYLGEGAMPEGVSLLVRNEADLAAFAHSRSAPGRPEPASTFFYVSGEIGVGAATVVNGAVSAGMRGWAGEIGHTLVDPAGPGCGCGARGCLEQYTGRDVLLERAGLPAGTTPGELADAALAGSAPALQAVERAGWALGIALSGAVNLLDVHDVVLGGSFAPLFDLLRPPVEEQLRTRVLASPWAEVHLRPAGDDSFPAVTGGAVAALETVISAPATWMRAPSTVAPPTMAWQG